MEENTKYFLDRFFRWPGIVMPAKKSKTNVALQLCWPKTPRFLDPGCVLLIGIMARSRTILAPLVTLACSLT